MILKIIFVLLILALLIVMATPDWPTLPSANPPIVTTVEEVPPDPSTVTEPDDSKPPVTTEPPAPDPRFVMLSEDFARWEFACDCPGYCDGFPTEPSPELIYALQALRNQVTAPIIITSGVRCEAWNTEVGGVAGSFHRWGQAADIYCPGVDLDTLGAAARDCGLNVLPYYRSGYIHVEIY